jgi:AcrR family transcriptional regulator
MSTPSPAPRVRLDLDARREQLMRIGLELFSTNSYDAVSIDEIAARAGISKGLLYHYFPSKREFYVAGVRAAAAQLRDIVEPDPELAPPQRLRVSLEAYLDYVEHHAEGYIALMRGGIGSDAEVREIVEESRAVIIDRSIAGLPLKTEPTTLLRLAMEGWVGYVEATSLSWLERRTVPRDRLRELLFNTFLVVVGAAAQADPSLELDLAALGGQAQPAS